MCTRKKYWIFPLLMLLLGLLGAALRLGLELFYLDHKGLIPQGHPLHWGMWLVAAAAVGMGLYHCLGLQKAACFEESFPKSVSGCLGSILAALGILMTVLFSQSGMGGNLGIAWLVLGTASVPCLAAAGWCRFQGKQPFFFLHLCPAMFLVAHTISQYQSWSSDPQLPNYVFSLLGIVCMIFFGFYQSTFDAGLLWGRRLRFFGLIAGCLGIMALPGCGYSWLYLGMTLWALLDCPVMAKRVRKAKEE